MILTFSKEFVVAVAALSLVVGIGCSRSPSEDAPAAAPKPDAAAHQAAGELLGALKLVRQEYTNAVAPEGGRVVDATEYAETELFSEQAQRKLGAWRAAGGLPEQAVADTLAAHLAKVHDGVAQKAPHATIVDAATAAIAIVQDALAGTVPESIRGTVLATARADQTIAAEEIAGEYRIGLLTDQAQAIFVRTEETLAPAPVAAPGTVYLAAVVREKRTKRPIAAAEVDVTIEGQGKRIETHLAEVWGDIHQYGANVVLPDDGPVTITVRASPPAYARHGDMLNLFVTPATATFQAHVRAHALAFDARPVTATAQDYSVGDDVLQAVAEAGSLHDIGPYRVGLILEGPEPVWLWKDGKTELEAVAPDATNHIEVVLIDRESGQLVPRARVDLTFVADGAAVGTAELHPLLSVFSHYGKTLTLPQGTTSVRIHVHPPALGSLGRPRLEAPADIELPLPKRRAEDA